MQPVYKPMPQTLIIGVGNAWSGDDAAGLMVARELRQRLRGKIVVLEHDGEGVSLIDWWSTAQSVIVIDAARSGAPPGTIHRFDASLQPLPIRTSHGSTHAFSVGEAIELARTLHRLPARVIVYSIEGQHFEAGQKISSAVQEAIPEVVERISREILGDEAPAPREQ